jgi:PAS domain S-box-containing protein
MTETNRSSGDRILRDPFSYHPWLKTILDSLSEGVIVTDDRGCVTYVNSEAEKLIGLRRADVIRRLIEDVYPLESMTESPVETYQIRSALSSTSPTGKQRCLLCRRDGRKILIEDSAAPLMSDGRVIGAVTVFAQVTNRLRHEHDQELEHEPHEAQMHAATEALGQTRSELRKLSADLMAAQEDERRRIGRELHDDFGQKIALLGMELEQLARMLPLEALTKRTLERLRKQITDLSHAIRETSHRLYPSVLNDLGFAPALRQLIEGFRGWGLYVNLIFQVQHPALKLDVA